MKKRRLAVLCAMWASPCALASPPVVVKVLPENGTVNVDPGLSRIRIVFDQPMARDVYSVVGGGPSFPKLTGKPRWLNNHTMVIPVSLEPDHEYFFSINSGTHTGFQNANGESAAPYPVRFWTAQKAGDEVAALMRDQNERAVGVLAEALATQYSHRDRLGVDWESRVGDFRERLLESKSPMAFAREASLLLGVSKDKHIWLRVGESRVGVYSSPVRPNENPSLLSKLVGEWASVNKTVSTGGFEDGIGYIEIKSWGIDRKDDLEAVFEAIGSMRDAPGLVIDVRLNSGGDEMLAQAVAGCFLDEPKLYAKQTVVTEDGGFSEPSERWVRPNHARPVYRGPIAVLTGPVVMSSNEGFLMMMRQVSRAKLVGARSQGSSGNPKPHDLGNGVTVYLPSWRSLTPEGEGFEGVGLEPDIRVDAQPRDFENTDPVLRAALEWIRSGG